MIEILDITKQNEKFYFVRVVVGKIRSVPYPLDGNIFNNIGEKFDCSNLLDGVYSDIGHKGYRDTITGDAEVILFYNLEKIPALSDDASITSGIAAYLRVFDKIKIVNGDVGTFGESFLRSVAETYTIAYDNVFLTGIVSGNLLDIADITYKNNPLSISLKTKEAKINVEFNKFGAVSMYTYENDSSYSFQAKFTYTK